MEEEVRTILRSVLSQPAPAIGLGSRLKARFLAMRIQEPCSDRARLQCGVGADAVRARSGGAGGGHCGRVLAFDLPVAVIYADLEARLECEGQPVAMADAQIAATCLAHSAHLATRNVRQFEGLVLTWVNPWLS